MKVFYFIKPTPANLAAYEKWSGSEIQSHAWLGDMVDEVFKVTLQEGNTMIIPSGWIHAVVRHLWLFLTIYSLSNVPSTHQWTQSCLEAIFYILMIWQCVCYPSLRFSFKRSDCAGAGSELKIRQIEVSTHVPKKFCFPMFSKCVIVSTSPEMCSY